MKRDSAAEYANAEHALRRFYKLILSSGALAAGPIRVAPKEVRRESEREFGGRGDGSTIRGVPGEPRFPHEWDPAASLRT